jgi:hypothetical protein
MLSHLIRVENKKKYKIISNYRARAPFTKQINQADNLTLHSGGLGGGGAWDGVVIATRYGLEGSGLQPRGGKIFSLLHTRPHQLWNWSSFLYNGYRSFFPEVKRPVCDFDHPPSFSIKDTWVILYIYSPSVPAWRVTGRPLPLLCILHHTPLFYVVVINWEIELN